MRLKNYRQLEHFMLRYHALLIRLVLNQEQPILVRMKHMKRKEKLFTTFEFDIKMRSGDIRRERLKAWDANYLWLLTAVAADFPNCEFVDCTPPELQVVNHTDHDEGEVDEKGQ